MSRCPVTILVEHATCLSSSNDEEEAEFSRRYERSYQPAVENYPKFFSGL